ncbi:MAG: ASPIC/UnbV domain-containing protein, partial [Verrucomicrobiales bacterium]
METGWPRQAMRNMLYVNTGIHRFKETAYMSGLSQSNWTWAVKLADFDCDGLTDVFLTNGMARNFSDADIPMTPEMLVGRTEFDAYKDTPPMPEKNLAFRNEGGLKFDDVSKAWGLDDLGMSYGAAQGDMDRDGDIDLVVLNLDDAVRVFRNDQDSGNRIVIECKGVTSNRAGWGATVRLETEGVNQMRFLHPISGFQGCDMPEAHFGLGTAKRVDVLTIDWPRGRRTVLSD